MEDDRVWQFYADIINTVKYGSTTKPANNDEKIEPWIGAYSKALASSIPVGAKHSRELDEELVAALVPSPPLTKDIYSNYWTKSFNGLRLPSPIAELARELFPSSCALRQDFYPPEVKQVRNHGTKSKPSLTRAQLRATAAPFSPQHKKVTLFPLL